MSDLLLWILAIVTVQNAISILYSKMRVKWITKKMEKIKQIYFEAEETYYENNTNRMKLKKHFVYNGVFFSSLSAFVANSVIEFFLSMLILMIQFFYLYHFYKKQKPNYYFTDKGIACVMIAHPIEKEQVGFKPWEEVKYYDESAEYLHLSGEAFKFEIQFEEETGKKIRSMARACTRYSSVQ